jgi:hypothetical protein
MTHTYKTLVFHEQPSASAGFFSTDENVTHPRTHTRRLPSAFAKPPPLQKLPRVEAIIMQGFICSNRKVYASKS